MYRIYSALQQPEIEIDINSTFDANTEVWELN